MSNKLTTYLEPPELVIDDSKTGLFCEQLFQARIISTEMRPMRMARMVGTFKTRSEAEAAGNEALRKARENWPCRES